MFPLSDALPSHKFPVINIVLILATVFVFFQQVTTPDSDAFVMKYALVPAFVDLSILDSLLPFVTSIFLHGGLLHILSNMWFLWIFGDNVEANLGNILYTILYFASGITGGFLQYIFMPDSTIPMLGASGAVAGVLGAYFVFFPHARIKTIIPLFGFVSVTEVSAYLMLGYWFVLQLLSGAASIPSSGDVGGVAFWAHVGGFVTGFLFAFVIKPFVSKQAHAYE